MQNTPNDEAHIASIFKPYRNRHQLLSDRQFFDSFEAGEKDFLSSPTFYLTALGKSGTPQYFCASCIV